MNDTKGLLQSKTTWGVLIALAGAALGWSPDAQAALSADTARTASLVIELAGLLVSLFGRAKASTKIQGLWQGKGGSQLFAWLLLWALVPGWFLGLQGCAGGGTQVQQAVARHEGLVELAVRVGVSEYLTKNPGSEAKMAEVVAAMQRQLAAEHTATVGMLAITAYSLIDWEALEPRRATLARALITAVQSEVEHQLTAQGIAEPEAVRLYLDKVLGWIADELAWRQRAGS